MTTSQPGDQVPEPQPSQPFGQQPPLAPPPFPPQGGGFPTPDPGFPPPQFGWAGPASFGAPPVAPVPRHRARTALFAVAGAAVVAGLASWGTLLVADHHDATTTSASSSSATHDAAAKTHGKDRVVGTVTGESGDTWTLTTTSGQHVTVDVGSATKYGTKADPSSATAVHTGESVRVAGVEKNGVVDATRVVPVSHT